jgi:hypothetical protein
MTRIAAFIALAVFGAVLAGCFRSEPAVDVRVLFVGNSYTFQHDIPRQIEKTRRLRDGARIRYKTAMVADGGRNLIAYKNDARVTELLQQEQWDFIVLQDRSTAAFYTREIAEFDQALTWFGSAAQREGAKLVFFQTWPRRTGHAFYGAKPEPGFFPPRSQPEMARRLASAYRNASGKYGGVVAPVGACWMQVEDKADLYAEDGSHASPSGARLAAKVIENTISGAADPCAGAFETK